MDQSKISIMSVSHTRWEICWNKTNVATQVNLSGLKWKADLINASLLVELPKTKWMSVRCLSKFKVLRSWSKSMQRTLKKGLCQSVLRWKQKTTGRKKKSWLKKLKDERRGGLSLHPGRLLSLLPDQTEIRQRETFFVLLISASYLFGWSVECALVNSSMCINARSIKGILCPST